MSRPSARHIVHESIQDQVDNSAMNKFKSLNVGDAMSLESQFGPLANAAHQGRIVDAVNALKAKGGQTHHSAPTPDSAGYYLSPTLITGVTPEETLEEIFGPVATVHSFKTDEEAVKLANQTPYGLGGYVYSKDEDHAMQIARQMNTGGVKVNGVSLLELNVDAPRPAWGLSGFGEEGTLETFDVFCGKSVVGVAGR